MTAPHHGDRYQRLQALEDALKYRRARIAEPCGACDALPNEQCDDHARDVGLIAEYERAARREMQRTPRRRGAFAICKHRMRGILDVFGVNGQDPATRLRVSAVHGPCGTSTRARELPAVRCPTGPMRARPRLGVVANHSHQMLEEACAAAEVEVGASGHSILIWLARFEPKTCAAIARLIRRAAAGQGTGAQADSMSPDEITGPGAEEAGQ